MKSVEWSVVVLYAETDVAFALVDSCELLNAPLVTVADGAVFGLCLAGGSDVDSCLAVFFLFFDLNFDVGGSYGESGSAGLAKGPERFLAARVPDEGPNMGFCTLAYLRQAGASSKANPKFSEFNANSETVIRHLRYDCIRSR